MQNWMLMLVLFVYKSFQKAIAWIIYHVHTNIIYVFFQKDLGGIFRDNGFMILKQKEIGIWKGIIGLESGLFLPHLL